MNWETILSSPPPEAATYYDAPRIDKAQALITRWGHNRPDIYAIHPIGARLAEECAFICEQVMVNTAYFAFWNVVKYTHRKQFSNAPENTSIDQILRSTVTTLSERLRRANKFIPTAKQNFEHFLYRNIATDTMGVARSIYQRLDLELIPTTATKMETWLAQNRKGSHGKTDYSLAAADVTDEQIDTAFGDYMERYGVPVEK